MFLRQLSQQSIFASKRGIASSCVLLDDSSKKVEEIEQEEIKKAEHFGKHILKNIIRRHMTQVKHMRYPYSFNAVDAKFNPELTKRFLLDILPETEITFKKCGSCETFHGRVTSYDMEIIDKK